MEDGRRERGEEEGGGEREGRRREGRNREGEKERGKDGGRGYRTEKSCREGEELFSVYIYVYPMMWSGDK